jgi:hypothetical protein
MKHTLTVALGIFVLASAANAALGEIVGSFRAPTTEIRGLARSDAYLFAVGFTTPNVVYRLNPTTGSQAGVWDAPRPDHCRGLAFSSGGHVWVGCYQNDTVYDCRVSDGSVRASWNAGHDPYGLAPHCTGDGGRGTTALFSADSLPAVIARHNLSTGSILSTYQRYSHFDIAYDHRNQLLWIPVYGPSVVGYRWGETRPTASFDVPAAVLEVTGLAYYGEYIFVAGANGYVYRVHCPGTVSAAPASFGKVKALFQ